MGDRTFIKTVAGCNTIEVLVTPSPDGMEKKKNAGENKTALFLNAKETEQNHLLGRILCPAGCTGATTGAGRKRTPSEVSHGLDPIPPTSKALHTAARADMGPTEHTPCAP